MKPDELSTGPDAQSDSPPAKKAKKVEFTEILRRSKSVETDNWIKVLGDLGDMEHKSKIIHDW